MISKGKKLSIDVILFTISSFGTRFLSFFLVPFYTNFLSTEEYGTIDLIVNTASLLIPIFTLCIYESVMRFTIEDRHNLKYIKVGWSVLIVGAVILGLGLYLVYLFAPPLVARSFFVWIWVLFVCNAIYNIFTSYTRATDRVIVMIEASILNSLILLILNIWLIAYVKIGVKGYLISTTAGLLIASLYMFIRISVVSKKSTFGFATDGIVMREMLQYSVPLIFTAIAWWINSNLDRYFVTGMLGVTENGIYSIAYKIPNVLVAFQTIFTQAWSISAVTEFDKDDKDGFMGYTYEMFVMFMILACSGIMLMNEPLSRLLYAKEFYSAEYYVPYLLIATFFGALAGYFGGIFAAVKNSKICAVSTIVSALVNTVLNIVLIPVFKIVGAAVATMIAYFCSWFVRAIVAKKYIAMKVDIKRLYFSFGLLFIQMICAIGVNHHYIVQGLIVSAIIIMYKKNIREAVRGAMKDVSKIFKR